MRSTMTVLHDTERDLIHFCDSVNDFWHDLNPDLDLFANVEQIMVARSQAHNVTRIEKLRACGVCVDYKVTFNVKPSYSTLEPFLAG